MEQGPLSKSPLILVGTTFLLPEEQIPSAGRLLVFDQNNLQLLQEFEIDGSLQAIQTTHGGKFLILGINNRVQAYAITQSGFH